MLEGKAKAKMKRTAKFSCTLPPWTCVWGVGGVCEENRLCVSLCFRLSFVCVCVYMLAYPLEGTFSKQTSDSGAQSGATHIIFLGKAMILKPRVVQSLYLPRETQRFWCPEWCNPYQVFKKTQGFWKPKT